MEYTQARVQLGESTMLAIGAMGGVVTAAKAAYGKPVTTEFREFLRNFLSQVRTGQNLEKGVEYFVESCNHNLSDPGRRGTVWMFFIATDNSCCVTGAETLQAAAAIGLTEIAQHSAGVN